MNYNNITHMHDKAVCRTRTTQSTIIL